MHVAVNRTVPPGYPYAADGGGKVFLPTERLRLHDAIAAYTIGSAWVNHADDVCFTIPSDEIALANVDLTFASGQLVHDRLSG